MCRIHIHINIKVNSRFRSYVKERCEWPEFFILFEEKKKKITTWEFSSAIKKWLATPTFPPRKRQTTRPSDSTLDNNNIIKVRGCPFSLTHTGPISLARYHTLTHSPFSCITLFLYLSLRYHEPRIKFRNFPTTNWPATGVSTIISLSVLVLKRKRLHTRHGVTLRLKIICKYVIKLQKRF